MLVSHKTCYTMSHVTHKLTMHTDISHNHFLIVFHIIYINTQKTTKKNIVKSIGRYTYVHRSV